MGWKPVSREASAKPAMYALNHQATRILTSMVQVAISDRQKERPGEQGSTGAGGGDKFTDAVMQRTDKSLVVCAQLCNVCAQFRCESVDVIATHTVRERPMRMLKYRVIHTR